MSRHKKTFAPRAGRSDKQKNNTKEDKEKPEQITDQDSKISLAKTEVTQITYDPFKNRAFSKVEKNGSVIQLFDKGQHVSTLNTTLEKLGHKVSENKAYFGDKTRLALINFQSNNGITASGIFDKETLLKMNENLEKMKDRNSEKGKDNTVLSAQSENPKTLTSEDSDSITYPIVIEKGQKFKGKLIQTDEDLNRFAEYKMNLTRTLSWEPKFTDEYVKEKVAKGGTVNYKISAKTHTIEKETEALSPGKREFIQDPTSAFNYIQNTRILDLLNQLSDEEIADYKTKVSMETTNLTAIEASLRSYIENRNIRKKEKNNREELQNQLIGLETLYKQYSNYIKFKRSHEATPYEHGDPNKAFFANALNKQLEELLISLKTNGFTLESFKKLITGYELSFRKETVHIAEDALIKYRHVLFEQKKKLLNDIFIKNLLEKIKASKAKESYEVANSAATPIIVEKPNSEERAFKNKMEALARSKKAEGNAAIKELSSTTPLVEDNGFNKEGFAKIETQQELRSFLENYISDQEENINKIITNLHANQGISIYGFASLLQKSKEQQGIAKNSIFDLIIADKESEESSKHIIKGLLIGVLAVALGLLTFGTGTVAVLLAAGNFALGAYITYEEIEAYRTQLAAYEVDISKDEPSAVWVVISVVGSILDAAAIAKISTKLVQAGRKFDITKDANQTRQLLTEAKLDPTTQDKVIKALESDLARIESLENKIQQNTVKQAGRKTKLEKLPEGKKGTSKTPYNPEQHSEFIDTPHNLTDGMSPTFISFKQQLEIAPLRNYLAEHELINFKKALDAADTKILNEINNQDKLINFVKSYKDNPKTFTQTVKNYEDFFGEYGWYRFWEKMPDFNNSSKTIDWLKSENKLLPTGDATHIELTSTHVYTVDGGVVNTAARFQPSWWGEYNTQIYKDLKSALEKLRKVKERNMSGKTVFSGRMMSLEYFESTLKNGKGKEIAFEGGMVSSSLKREVAEGFIELSAKNAGKGKKVAIIRKINSRGGVYIDDLSDWGSNLGPIRHSDANPSSTMIQEEVLMNEGFFRQTSDPKYLNTIDDIEYYEIEFLELLKPLN
ncbi:hypothetical protein HNP24_001920 [Chryseobacterium sediminis]|uniref:Peptidoglycan binding-like domain-containing protein n=1 Tax=Chryseobacterium sediminis TaxID=1679494 RepID=A0ABR6PZ20_9FLAO|nr:peptidoglycan-binding domain-containing protein [Chryseobacterium sediminis]MBB6330970.1 hypothetical protein [Chryseobacterium sediminis]